MCKFLYHYLLIDRSGLFDRRFYLKAYPDVRRADTDPILHYVKSGWKEGRRPSTGFDPAYYVSQYPDVREAKLNPLVHYILFGRKENRRIQPAGETPETEAHRQAQQPSEPANAIPPVQVDQFINETISIIIPTKNAGDQFDGLLKTLLNQQGFKDIEIIVVDSGSSDDTVSIAREHQLKVIEIPPESFSHSYARNLGADNASGDLLLFTVQDALPPNNTWLAELMAFKQAHNLSAVSCAEQPRPDADLYYQIVCWYHYQFLGVNGQNRILEMPEKPDYKSLRQNGQLSDLANLVSRDLFEQFRYRFNYAEDLDLGMRLIRSGHRLGFMGTTRIIHSHNRPAYYFLKRGYVDNLFLSEIFGDVFPLSTMDFTSTVADIGFTLNYFCNTFRHHYNQLDLPMTPQAWQEAVRALLHAAQKEAYPPIGSLADFDGIDRAFSTLVNRLTAIAGYQKSGMPYDGQIIQNSIGFIKITRDFLTSENITVDRTVAEGLLNALLRSIALSSGARLAHCYLRSAGEEREKLQAVHVFLQESV